MPHIVLLGTLDTKLEEFLYLHEQLTGIANTVGIPLKITLIDCGRQAAENNAIMVSQRELVSRYGAKDARPLSEMQRGEVIRYMIDCATACMKDIMHDEPVHGIIGAGGTGGTSLVSAVMRDAAPLGMPKLIVSTIASGNTAPVVGETDITLMNSVVDIAGTNDMLRGILSNAAGAMIGMSLAYQRTQARKKDSLEQKPKEKHRIGVTMFGVTTPCVDQIRKHLTECYPVDIYIFHAAGHGGLAMERMVREGRLDAVLDLSTTEICDHVAGGTMDAGPTRLEAALQKKIPNIISVGATDMVNFGAMNSVPEQYKNRRLLEHNPVVTLMRTTKEECEAVGAFIVEKVKNFMVEPELVQVWLPRGGVSMIAKPGQIFEDEEADAALATVIKKGLEGTGVRIVEDARDINDLGFATDIAESLMRIVLRGVQK